MPLSAIDPQVDQAYAPRALQIREKRYASTWRSRTPLGAPVAGPHWLIMSDQCARASPLTFRQGRSDTSCAARGLGTCPASSPVRHHTRDILPLAPLLRPLLLGYGRCRGVEEGDHGLGGSHLARLPGAGEGNPLSLLHLQSGWQAHPPVVRAGYTTRSLQFPPE
jgi:hypothetical protein